MEYIFEDKYDKGIPFLYRQGYDENMLRHFHFVGGSGNIQSERSANAYITEQKKYLYNMI